MAQELVITVQTARDAGNALVEDTGGYALVDGQTATTMGSLWQIAPNVAIKWLSRRFGDPGRTGGVDQHGLDSAGVTVL